MKAIGASAWLAAVVCLLVRADEKDSPPVAISQPEPEWGPELSKAYLANPAKVTMVIDDRGVPFSLSGDALPDNVVSALSEWRFRPGRKDGANVPFSISFIVPLRTPLNASTERTLRRRRYFPSKAVSDMLRSGTGLDIGRAEKLERSLEVDLNDADKRAELLLYSLESATQNPKDAAERRARHIEFLVQNLPENPVLASSITFINAMAGPLLDPEAYAKVRDVWLKQIPLKPDDAVILEHATYFLRVSDAEKTEQLLLPALRSVPDAGIWIGDLYGLAMLGVNGLDLKTGLAVSAPPAVPSTAFAQRARATLLASNNPKILIAALNTLTDHGRALASSEALPQGYPALCSQLLSRLKELEPESGISCDLSSADPSEPSPLQQAVSRIRVGGNVQQANLVKKVTPQYPPDAKTRGIQGEVRFLALIDKDGSIKSLTLVSGPLPLYKSARDAVRQWQYKPTLLNGNPVEVVTTLIVNYTLSR